jgi:two-component system response regulator AtoC
MVSGGQFREDLFYRLNVVPIWIPPLRQRPGDVERLARHFCAELGALHGRSGVTLEADALELLCAQPWPGNVRQLQNFIERMVVLSDRPRLGAAEVERELTRLPGPRTAAPEASLGVRKLEAEKSALQDALARAGGNRTLAARLLGVSRRTLYNKLGEHGLG